MWLEKSLQKVLCSYQLQTLLENKYFLSVTTKSIFVRQKEKVSQILPLSAYVKQK